MLHSKFLIAKVERRFRKEARTHDKDFVARMMFKIKFELERGSNNTLKSARKRDVTRLAAKVRIKLWKKGYTVRVYDGGGTGYYVMVSWDTPMPADCQKERRTCLF